MPALLGVVLGVPTAASLAADEAAIAANTSAISGNTASITALTSRLDNRDQKDSVRAASLTNLTLSGTQTIDGVACIAGDRVAALGQTSAATSCIYVVAAGAWARAADAATSAMVTSGMWFFVEEGTANGGKAFELTTANPITLGSTALTFAHFAGALKASEVTNDSSVTGATSKDALNTLLAADALLAPKYRTYRTYSGATDTAVLADGGNVITPSSASAVTQTVPANSSVPYPVDTIIEILQLGAGQVSLVVTTDTLTVPVGYQAKCLGQGHSIFVKKIATTQWVVSGSLLSA